MTPPLPWGHVVYTNAIEERIFGVPGDFAELGVGGGGSSVFFARLAKKYRRKFLSVDSFEGLPEPDEVKDASYFMKGDYRPLAEADNHGRFLEYVQRFDVADIMTVIKAFFGDLVVPKEFEAFAFVHIDGDLYSSVYEALEKVWDRVSPGGIVA